MSMRYPIEVTVDSQTSKVKERLERYEKELELIKLILPVVEKYEGKTITKHIATACQKVMPEGYDIELNRQYGMFHLDISRGGYGKGQSYERLMQCLIGYDSSPVVNMEKIKGYVKCYTLNEERIPRLKKGMERIPEMVALRNQALELISKLIKEAEKYEMDYDFELEK